MKGPSLYPKYNKKWGNSPLHEEKVTSDKGDKDVKTGDITWGDEKKISENVTNDGNSKTTTTNYETKGTSKGKKVEKQLDPNDPDYKKKLEAWKNAPEKNKDKYRDKTHVKNRSETSTEKKKEELIKIPPRKIKLIQTDDGEPTPAEYIPPKKKDDGGDDSSTTTRKRRRRKIDLIPGDKYSRRGWRRKTGHKIKRAIKKLNPFKKKERCTRWW